MNSTSMNDLVPAHFPSLQGTCPDNDKSDKKDVKFLSRKDRLRIQKEKELEKKELEKKTATVVDKIVKIAEVPKLPSNDSLLSNVTNLTADVQQSLESDKNVEETPQSATEIQDQTSVVEQTTNEVKDDVIDEVKEENKNEPVVSDKANEEEETVNDEPAVAVVETPIEKEQLATAPKNTNEEIKVEEKIPLSPELLALNEKVSNLSEEAHQEFNTALRETLKMIGGFQSLFSKDNSDYRSEGKNLEKPLVKEKYSALKTRTQDEYRIIDQNYSNFKEIVFKNIGFLNDAIKLHSFEKEALQESTSGNQSYLSSFSIINLKVGYKYGFDFRYWEITNPKGALETRKANIGLKTDAEKKPEVVFLEEKETLNATSKKIITLSLEIDTLKERVLVINESLEKDSKEMIKSDIPKRYYLYQKQQLDALKGQLDELKSAQETRIKELELVIERENVNLEAIPYLNAVREKTEIMKRWEMINLRHDEVLKLLNNRKSVFKLSDETLNSKEEVKLDDLSTEYQKAFDLLNRITSLKEDLILGNTWEKWASPGQRETEYFKAVKKTEELKEEKAKFVSEALPNRVKVLETAVETYRGYIKTLQQGIQAIDEKLSILKIERKERQNWQVGAVKV